jgi:hypothetical protein
VEVVVTEPRHVQDLARFLQTLDYLVETIDPMTLHTVPRDAREGEDAGLELDLYLLVWRALHLDADAHRVS